MKIKTILLTTLGTALCGLTLSACKDKGKVDYAPDGSIKAKVDVIQPALRATFEGVGYKNNPTKINWGTVGSKLPMLIYKGTGSATLAELELFGEYVGMIGFTYLPSEMSGNVLKYFVSSGRNDQANFGASINSGSIDSNGVKFLTALPPSASNVDMSKEEVDWPLTSVSMDSQKNVTNHLMNDYFPTKSNYLKFDLFGNMFMVRFTNILGLSSYTANSTNLDANLHPKLTLESNCMAFAGSAFTGKEVSNKPAYALDGTAINKVIFRISNIDFADNAARFPIWFRPVTPAGGETPYIKIIWEVYNGSAWEKAEYSSKVFTAEQLAATGTPFSKLDGYFYGMSVGISPIPKVEVGSNAFYVVDVNNIPPFD